MKNQDKMSRLNIECRQKDKGAWVQAARASDKGLEEWVNDILNEAVKRADLSAPAWMTGFSKRTSDALMLAQIYKSSELLGRIEEDALLNIQGLAPGSVQEIMEWYHEGQQS
ncbi:hypothetical protein [Marinobacterium stanieri]|uniref:hypothetical protein n=1 Tax=Marinobacterium stanieri TaxID=49186 RepID=UPI000255781A|nr:hypothetical protein [Marinobacterium stanieri]